MTTPTAVSSHSTSVPSWDASHDLYVTKETASSSISANDHDQVIMWEGLVQTTVIIIIIIIVCD